MATGGMNKMLADLENLSVSDHCYTENSAHQTGGRTENVSKSSTKSDEVTDKDFNRHTADKSSSSFLRHSYDDAFLEGVSGGESDPPAIDEIRERIISGGEEIADLIVGSFRALDIFQSFYDEWAVYRRQSQTLLEQLAETIANSSKKSEKVRTFIRGIENAERDFQAFPNPVLSLGARLAAMFSTLILKLFGPSYSKDDVAEKEFEIRQLFQKDIDSSSTVYIHGVQCALQFEETCKAISEFRIRIRQQNLKDVIEDKTVLEFLSDVSDFNPSNVSVFYKILRRAYERLIENSKSKESRAFVKVFEVMPAAVGVINLLCWRFDSDGFDNSLTQGAWDDLFDIFTHSDTYTLGDFLGRIRHCLFFLEKERAILEKSVLSLLKEKI